MHAPSFFGYGSLVNLATHPYPNARPGRVEGWARRWVQLPEYQQAILTAVRAEGSVVDGVLADVPGADWQALDAREAGYERCELDAQTAIYAVDLTRVLGAGHAAPILMSYLDVVVQGYLQQFGEAGATQFFATTQGWDTPILDDRDTPRYPRHQNLSAQERQVVDKAITALGCNVMPP